MNRTEYGMIESYMLEHMKDGAHDREHMYRVLYYVLDIARFHTADTDILIAAALLHDIGRFAQFKNPQLDHAAVGAEMAYNFLISSGWKTAPAEHVRDCISTHRYRKNHEPATAEAKILFDADKLDATGTVGLARTFAYIGIAAVPFYSLDTDGNILDGTQDTDPSFFHEYNFKLKHLYDTFYTERAAFIASKRKDITRKFYESMLEEVREPYNTGSSMLKNILKN